MSDEQKGERMAFIIVIAMLAYMIWSDDHEKLRWRGIHEGICMERYGREEDCGEYSDRMIRKNYGED